MIRIREAIIVEGRYDKNTLAQVVDAPILETSGFGIFHDSQRLALLRRLAETRGIIVLTDSDGAGFVIRNYLRGAIDPTQVKHAYIPDVAGKERRKRTASKEGKLGVEGMRPEVLLEALRRAGATVVIYEPTLKAAAFDGLPVIASLTEFKRMAAVIVANRTESALDDVPEKVYTSDLYRRD